MANKSTYLQYLPAVLYADDPPPPQFSLGTMLLVFEKLLSGIDDGQPIVHGKHTHDSIQEVIARLFRLYDPWGTPPQFLDWLAQWVALQFPAIWDEYQRRKITSEIVQIYARRGLKDGLDDFLDLYAVSARRPRVVIDDCSKILFNDPATGQATPIYTFVSQEPLIAPHCIALGPDGKTFFVGDEGNNQGAHQVNPGVWRISATGQYDFTGPVAHAQPLGPANFHPIAPVAVVADGAVPFGIYILDGGVQFVLDHLTYPAFNDPVPQVVSAVQLGVSWGIAMALDLNGHVLVLDRGAVPGVPSASKIVDVTMAGAPPVFQAKTNHNLAIVEPLSLAVLPNGNLIVGDGGNQANAVPADLILVNRANPNNWVTASLLGAVPAQANPLVAPTAIVVLDANHLLVLDAGLKPFALTPASPFNSVIAQQAAVYYVDLTANPPTIALASEKRQLVYPRGMVQAADGALHICDPGLPDLQGFSMRLWRSQPQQFAAVVHFPGPPAVTPQQKQDRNKFLQSIRDVITGEKPAQSNSSVLSES